MPDLPNAENTPGNFPATDTDVPHRPGAGSRSPEDVEAILAKIEQILCLDNGEPYEPLPGIPCQREPNGDGLIVKDGEGVDPNCPPTVDPWPSAPPVG